MRLPTLLSRRNKNVHKNTFGHVLILAGSRNMLGAAALCGLSAMRSGAGLVTVGIPKGLNNTLHKKLSPVIMTLPLPETSKQTLSFDSYKQLKTKIKNYDCIALGPGLSQNRSTQKLILKTIETSPKPLVIDADALNALEKHMKSLTKTSTPKILTPHPGEMSRITGIKKSTIEYSRKKISQEFSQKYSCTLVLKGHKTVVASPDGKTYINKTGNPGMATAGAGDVLTGIIAAFLAQGLEAFKAAKLAVYIHGKAADLAAKKLTRLSMIATDIIENIPSAVAQVK